MMEAGASSINSEKRIESSLDNGILHLVLVSADGMNTIGDSFFNAVAVALNDAAIDSRVRVVLLSARGKAFCAGADLRDTDSPSITFLEDGYEGSPMARMMESMVSFPKPLVAAVHGSAVGGGATLLLHCDLAVAAANSKFKLPFASLGLIPELGSSYLLPRAAGPKLASELALLGETVDAHVALRAGFINAVVAPGDELAHARRWAEKLAAMAPGPVRETKRLLREAQHDGLSAAIAREALVLLEVCRGEVVRESINAFREKRAPDFSRFH